MSGVRGWVRAGHGTHAKFTVPGLSLDDGHRIGEALQLRLHALNDLQLTLKHVHWNVVGPHFIGVHEMLDPQIEAVRAMVDKTAERMATLGRLARRHARSLVAAPHVGRLLAAARRTTAHLGALDLVYTGVIEDHRKDIELADDSTLTEDMLIGQLGQLELFQWFVRAHLERAPVTSAATARTREQDARPRGHRCGGAGGRRRALRARRLRPRRRGQEGPTEATKRGAAKRIDR